MGHRNGRDRASLLHIRVVGFRGGAVGVRACSGGVWRSVCSVRRSGRANVGMPARNAGSATDRKGSRVVARNDRVESISTSVSPQTGPGRLEEKLNSFWLEGSGTCEGSSPKARRSYCNPCARKSPSTCRHVLPQNSKRC